MSNQVVLFFRKKREAANFSIERSFTATQIAFEQLSFPTPKWFTLSHYSVGILPRIRAILEARKNQGDINHITGDINFLVLGLPGKKTILTILDCGFLRHDNPLIRAILKWIWLDWPVKHVAHITAISESTKQEIIQFTNCDPNKITVIPVVITSDFYPIEKEFNQESPTILHIGTAFNKNLARHIEALAGIPCHLHIIGKLKEEDRALLAKHKIEYSNEFDISAAQIFEAYKNCDLLLFASTVEGFGMPILEAQTIGRAVITSNVTSMPEVAGKGACMVDPFDVKSIRTGIKKVIREESYRNTLIAEGFENIKRYQALGVAKQYADLYQNIIIKNYNVL